MRGARMGRYALWQLRDYFVERGAALVLIGAVFTAMAWAALRELSASPLALHGAAQELLGSMLPQIAVFGTLLAANGIVANDLRQGYFRFLFAKPVGAPRYYAQAFLVNGAGLALLVSAVAWALGAVTGRPLAAPMLPYVLLHYLSLGAIIFLASTVSVAALGRFDWLAASALWFGAYFVHAMASVGRPWARALLPLLPPSWRARELFAAAMGEAAWPLDAVLHLAGYGAVCFLLGLVVLRYRPLAA